MDERQTIEEIRETLQTCVIPEVSEFHREYENYSSHSNSSFAGSQSQLLSLSRGPKPNPSYILLSTPDPRLPTMYLLTLKLYDALETHSQFSLSNAVLGLHVVEFVKGLISKYEGKHKDELIEMVKVF